MQQRGRPGVEARAVLAACAARGITSEVFSLKRIERRQLALSPETFVFGDHDVMRAAFAQLAVDGPWLEGYPDSLRPWLRREVWACELQAARREAARRGRALFVKPRDAHKRFSGHLLDASGGSWATQGVSARLEVWCGEPVRFLSEFRAYVVDGVVAGLSH